MSATEVARTPKSSSSSSSSSTVTAVTPTVAPLIPVQSHDFVTMLQHTYKTISQQWADEDSWEPEQRRCVQNVLAKFGHNVFAYVRKNVTVSSSMSNDGCKLVEPLNRALAAEVAALDSEVDDVAARVAALREEVPRLQEQQLKAQQVTPNKNYSSGSDDAEQPTGAMDACDGIGSVICHVASEMNTVAIEFKGVKKDLDTAVSDCASTLKVVRRTLNKPQSSTEQAIFAATDISNGTKRKVGGKSTSPKKRVMVNKENE